MPIRILLLLALAASWGGGARPMEAETECESRRTAFYEDAHARRMDGHEERVLLISRAQRLINVYAARAPMCTGRLYEHLAYLLVVDHQHAEAVNQIQAYFARAGDRVPARAQVNLGIQLGYALNQLGQTLNASQAYFKAAKHADGVEARFGARALVEAAATARVLGDDAGSLQYLATALGLIQDSLAYGSNLETVHGLALTSLGNLLEHQLAGEERPRERRRLIRLLDQTAQRAISALGQDGQAAGYRALSLNLSALANAMEGRFGEARAIIQRARVLALRAGVLLPTALFETELMRSRVLELQGDQEGARQAALEARQDAAQRHSVLDETRAIERLAMLAEQEQAWESAEDLYQQAVFLNESYRARLGLQDWSVASFGAMQAPYRGLVRVRLAAGDVRGAFVALEQTRARYLIDLRHHLEVRRHLSPAARGEVDSLTTALSEARLEAVEEPSTTRRAALTLRISTLQHQIETSTRTPLPGNEGVDIAALQYRLGTADRTLVSYFLDGRSSTAFVVRSDTLVALPLDVSPARLRSVLGRTAALWRGDEATDPAFSLAGLHELYQRLVAEVEPWIEGDDVVVIPDGEIASIPFGMLVSAPAQSYESADYLVRKWRIGTDVAASLVEGAAIPRHEADHILSLGFDGSPGSTWNTRSRPPLTHVDEEIEAIAIYKGGNALVGRAASEAAFERLAPRADIIHIASHAEANPALPLYSRIGLAGDSDEDGTLHLYEILQTPLDADLVVLSGCSTSRGQNQSGEGVIGLQYGMRAAGARATISTQWPVADKAMAEIMGDLYRGLARGLDKAEALRQAQLAYLASHEGLSASPFYWAAPVLSGDPSPVGLQKSHRWLVWSALLGVAMMAWLAWRLRRPPAHV